MVIRKLRKETFRENILNPDSELRKELFKAWKEYLEHKENKKKTA